MALVATVAVVAVTADIMGIVASVKPLKDLFMKLREILDIPNLVKDAGVALEAVEEALQLLEVLKELKKTWSEEKQQRFEKDLDNFRLDFQNYLDERGFLQKQFSKLKGIKLRNLIKKFTVTLNKLREELTQATNVAQTKHNHKHVEFMDRTWNQLDDLHKKQDEQRQALELLVENERVHEPATSFEDEKWTSSVVRESKSKRVKETETDLVKQMCDQGTDERKAEKIAWALCDLATKADDERPSNWRNAIEELVKALGSVDPINRRRRMFATRVLRRLPVGVLDAKEIMPLLADVVKPNPDDPEGRQDEEVTAACAVLAKLAGAVVKEPDESHQVAKQENALCLALHNAEEECEEARQVLESLVESMVQLVSAGSPHQQKHAANALRELAANESCADKIRELGGIRMLVDLLYVGHSSDHRCGALGALWNLAVKEEARDEIVAETGVDAIVEQLRVKGTEEQRQLAASALAVLAWDDASDDLIGAAGGVELLVQLLRTGTTNQKISSVHALSQLANNESNATKMVSAKAVRSLVASLRSGTGADLRSKAGTALALIAKFTKEKEAFVDAIRIRTIKELLMNGSDDAVLCSARVIAAVCDEVDDVQHQLGTEDVIQKLVRLVDVADGEVASLVADREKLVRSALAALQGLADGNDEIQRTIGQAKGRAGGNAGGIGVLVKLLRRLSLQDTDELYVEAAKTLDCVATTSELKQALIHGDAVKLFLAVLENGSPHKKLSTVTLVTKLVPELKPSGLVDITRTVCNLLQTHRGESELVAVVLLALRKLVIQDKTAMQEHTKTCELLVEMLSDANDLITKERVALVLSSLTNDPVTAKVLLSAGIIGPYAQAADDESVRLACLQGLAKLAAHEERRQHVDWERVVGSLVDRLADSAPQVQVCAAEVLSLLSPDRGIAAKIGATANLKNLVLVATGAWSPQSKFSLRTLRNLCEIPDNLLHLVETGLCEAIVDRMKELEENKNSRVGLELLEKLSADRKAAGRLAKEDVMNELVARCVAALGKSRSKLRHAGLAILTNLYDHATSPSMVRRQTDDNDPEVDDSDIDENGTKCEEEDSDSESDGSEEDDINADELLGCVSTKDRINSLVRVWPKMDKEDRPGFIRLLEGLALRDLSCRIKLRKCISPDVLVRVIRNGTVGEQSGAASVLSALVKSKTYCEEATEAGAVDAFVDLVVIHGDSERIKDSTTAFLAELQHHEVGDAVQKLLETLLSKAGDPEGVSNAARDLLEDLTSVATSCASLATACAIVLERPRQQRDRNAVNAVLNLVGKLCDSDNRYEMCGTGDTDRVVKALVSFFNASKQGSRLAITHALCKVAYYDAKGRQSRRIGAKCIDTLVKMSLGEHADEKAMAFETLAALCEGHASNLSRLNVDKILELCEQNLERNEEDGVDEGVIVYAALTLVAVLAENNEKCVLREAIFTGVVRYLNDDKFEYQWRAARTIEALARYRKACEFFANHRVKKKLKQLSKKGPSKRAATAALEALQDWRAV